MPNQQAVKEGTVIANGATGTVQSFSEYMIARAGEEKETAGAGAFDSQLASMISAQTEAEVWAADESGTIQGRDLIGCEVRIHDLTSHESTNEEFEGNGFFVTCNATLLAGPKNVLTAQGLTVGQDFVLSTGAILIIGKIRWYESKNKLPFDGLIVKAGRAIKLARIPERAVQAG